MTLTGRGQEQHGCHPPAGDCCAPVPAGSAAGAPGPVPAGSPAAPPGAAAAPAEPPSRPPVWHSAREGDGRWLSGSCPALWEAHALSLTVRSTSMSRPCWVSTGRGSVRASVAKFTGYWRSCGARFRDTDGRCPPHIGKCWSPHQKAEQPPQEEAPSSSGTEETAPLG